MFHQKQIRSRGHTRVPDTAGGPEDSNIVYPSILRRMSHSSNSLTTGMEILHPSTSRLRGRSRTGSPNRMFRNRSRSRSSSQRRRYKDKSKSRPGSSTKINKQKSRSRSGSLTNIYKQRSRSRSGSLTKIYKQKSRSRSGSPKRIYKRSKTRPDSPKRIFNKKSRSRSSGQTRICKRSRTRPGSPKRILNKKSRSRSGGQTRIYKRSKSRSGSPIQTFRKRSPPQSLVGRARTMAPVTKRRWSPSPSPSSSRKSRPKIRSRSRSKDQGCQRRRAMTSVAQNKRTESSPPRKRSKSGATRSPSKERFRSGTSRKAGGQSQSLRSTSTYAPKPSSPTPKRSKTCAKKTPDKSSPSQEILRIQKNIKSLIKEKAKKDKKKKKEKSKKRSLSGDGIPRIHHDNHNFEPPSKSGPTKAGHIHCQICQSYFLHDLDNANQHIALHKDVTFCAKIPQDQWFFNIEDVVVHLAANKFKKHEVREKILTMNLVQYPDNLKCFCCEVCTIIFSRYSDFIRHVRSEKCAPPGHEGRVCIVWCRACHTRFVSVDDLKLHIKQENKKCFLSDQILNRVYSRASMNTINIKTETEKVVVQNYVQHAPQPMQPPTFADMPGHLPNIAVPVSDSCSPPFLHTRYQEVASTSSLSPLFNNTDNNFKISLPSLPMGNCSRLSTPPARPDPKMSLACSPPRNEEPYNVYTDLYASGHQNVHQHYPDNVNLQQILQTVSSSRVPVQPATFSTDDNQGWDEEPPVFGKELPKSPGGGRNVRTASEDVPVTISSQSPHLIPPPISNQGDADSDDDIQIMEALTNPEMCERNICFWNGQHVAECIKLVISKRCGEGRCKPSDLHQCWGFMYNKFAKKVFGSGGHICPRLLQKVHSNPGRVDPRLKIKEETPVIPHLDLRLNIKTENGLPLPQCENPDPRLRGRQYPRSPIERPEEFVDIFVKDSDKATFFMATWNSSKAKVYYQKKSRVLRWR